MAHYNTILNQITAFIPRHDFNYLAKIHHSGQRFRSYNRWSQFMAMLIGQLSGRKSLRDITDNLKAQQRRLYHLGMKPTSRATLARVNEQQPASLYEFLFAKVLEKCQRVAPHHKFSFKAKLHLLDTTTIDLCLSAFPWAKFRSRKGAIRLHTGLDADGYLCVYLLVAFLNFKAKLGSSMQQILRVLQLNLFSRCNLKELFKPPDRQPIVSPQLFLWDNL